MAQVAVVYHSGHGLGHTQRMAQAVAAGAGAELIAIDAGGNLPAGGQAETARLFGARVAQIAERVRA